MLINKSSITFDSSRAGIKTQKLVNSFLFAFGKLLLNLARKEVVKRISNPTIIKKIPHVCVNCS